jgi:peroxiredoxin Q/BCP
MRMFVAAVGVLTLLAAGGVAAEPPKVGDTAKDFDLKLLDEPGQGKSLKLTEMTAKGPVVLVVLRGWPGYQCPICAKQFMAFLDKAPEFKQKNAQVVFVYPGPRDNLTKYATDFFQGKTYPDDFHVVTDPDYAFTNAYNLRWDAPKETAYPSTFVIGKGGKITFAKVSKTHGGRADVKDALAAIPAK